MMAKINHFSLSGNYVLVSTDDNVTVNVTVFDTQDETIKLT
jgi:hypothetical protein